MILGGSCHYFVTIKKCVEQKTTIEYGKISIFPSEFMYLSSVEMQYIKKKKFQIREKLSGFEPSRVVPPLKIKNA